MKAIQYFMMFLLTALPITAQNRGPKKDGDKPDFEKWFKEVREFKHKFMVKELNLTDDQKNAFFKILDNTEDEINEVSRKSREVVKEINEKKDKVTSEDYEKASKILFEQKQKEAEIELKAYNEYKKVLSAEQLFKLKDADWKFTRGLMDNHRRLQGGGDRKPGGPEPPHGNRRPLEPEDVR